MILSSTAHVLFFRLFTPQIICLPLSSKCHSSRSGTSRSLKQNKQGESIEDKHNIYSCLHKPIQSLSRIANNSLTHSLTHSLTTQGSAQTVIPLNHTHPNRAAAPTRRRLLSLLQQTQGKCRSQSATESSLTLMLNHPRARTTSHTRCLAPIPHSLFHSRSLTLAVYLSQSHSRCLTCLTLAVSLSLSHSRCSILAVAQACA